MKWLAWFFDGCSAYRLARWATWGGLFTLFGVGQVVVLGTFWRRGLIRWGTEEVSPLLAAWHPARDLMWGSLVLAALVVVAIVLGRYAKGSDPVLFLAFGALMVLGGIVLARLAPDLALHRQRVAFGALAGAQLKAGLIALAALAGTALCATPPVIARLGRRKYLILLDGLVLIVLTMFVGVTVNARRLWLTIGGLTLQPVEILKLAVVLFLAFYLAEEAPLLSGRWRSPLALPPLRVLGAGGLMAGLALSALAIQGDFGPVVQLYLVAVTMAYVATGSLTLIAASLGLFLGGGAVAYFIGFPSIVRTRIDMWANPFDLSEGMTRALWAIASGGFWGKGLGAGHPEMVPVVHSDYILAGIAEELGMIGVAAVVALYATIAIRGYTIAAVQPVLHARLLAMGLTTLLAVQVLLVAGGNAAWIPMTGLTLPGLSHGGTSLVVTAASIGLLLRLSAAPGHGASRY